MVELPATRQPLSSRLQSVLNDCIARDADYMRDKEFSNIKPVLRLELWEIQYGLCVYCESSLPNRESMLAHSSLPKDHRTRIGHVVPRVRHNERRFSFENLVLSCGLKTSCDQRKKDKDLVLHPTTGVNSRFQLLSNGRLHPASKKGTQHFKEECNVIETLGLNSSELISERAKTLAFVQDLTSAEDFDIDDTRELVEGLAFKWTLSVHLGLT